ncbi:hypothetical protein JYK21_05105 [Ralstonia pickettii]|nr:hypothetical protein [Ralstonia pickettii]
MSFWNTVGKIAAVVVDKAPEVMAKVAAEGAKRQGEIHKKYGRQLNEYESKLKRAEENTNNVSAEQRKKIKEAREKLEEAKRNMSKKGMQFTNSGKVLYGNKSVNEWNAEWRNIGYLKSANLTPYNKYIGLYRHKIGGKVMYVGRAVEVSNGGFRKRLSDYRRGSDSARKHQLGRIINENLEQITTDILIVGDTAEAVKVTRLLEGQFIAKFNPPWNKQRNI